MKERQGGQFFFAKAFDKFAPTGPVLLEASLFESGKETKRMVTTVNGEVRQESVLFKDMIFSPARVLSHMSQGQYQY